MIRVAVVEIIILGDYGLRSGSTFHYLGRLFRDERLLMLALVKFAPGHTHLHLAPKTKGIASLISHIAQTFPQG